MLIHKFQQVYLSVRYCESKILVSVQKTECLLTRLISAYTDCCSVKYLILNMLGKNFSRRQFKKKKKKSYFSKIIGFEISYKLLSQISPGEKLRKIFKNLAAEIFTQQAQS